MLMDAGDVEGSRHSFVGDRLDSLSLLIEPTTWYSTLPVPVCRWCCQTTNTVNRKLDYLTA
jgi:hypothetical protein